MSNTAALQKVSEETMRFMRGKYALDEIGITNDKNAPLGGVKFRRGGKTVVTIYIYDDRFDFLVIFGKAEREKFEAQRNEFPQAIQDIYDNSKTYHDGKWMTVPVADLETLDAVKQMIMIKKKPNRKPFPKAQAVFSRCGMRCDLCVHYTGGTISDGFREELKRRVGAMYGPDGYGDDMMLCPGGTIKDCGDCVKLRCPRERGLDSCTECPEFPCGNCGLVTSGIDAHSTSAEDVTWAVLPYVDGQYGN